ncbi:recombinase family protein [Nocardia bovistercoris]|uniref:Recombinase family protein n=1 Tax=Nocardia bovistercoris TaxID=2785916 RepID=A0A931ICI3_9NOCA|nr:recombinase family protein [Nocardia bovistercoris]MBH0777288.1 recombinase family protein [Nocardia bovistercoris]
MAGRAAIYCRISEDPRSTEKGVARQRDDAERLAAIRGWEVVRVFIDNDVSALGAKHRRDYEAMLGAAVNGEFDYIVAYGLSRLWRNRKERAHAIEVLSKARVGIALVKGSDIDLTSAAGRMYAGVLGEFDTAESEIKGERIARAAKQRAEEGRANGACAYGWRRIYERDAAGNVLGWRDVEDPQSADVVRSIVADLLAGRSMNSIVSRLNDASIPTPQQKGAWRSSLVRKLALRKMNIAVRTHRGQDFSAAWPPIIERDDHDRVTALLTAPGRATTKGGARRHLLSFGIGRCGKCGSFLRVANRGGPNILYICDTNSGCVGRRMTWVDELVTSVVCARLTQPDARDLFAHDDSASVEARARLEAIRARLDGAADTFADGAIDAQQLARITAKLKPELLSAEAEVAQTIAGLDVTLISQITTQDAREVWDNLVVTQRIAVLQALGVRVTLLPARGGPGFKPESVRITWEVPEATDSNRL